MKRATAVTGLVLAAAMLPAVGAEKTAAATPVPEASGEQLHPIHSGLSLAQASRIVDAAIAAAREHKLLPLTVVVLDSGSHLVAFKREDGAGNLRFEIARGKAAAALGMGMSTRLIRDRLGSRVAFQSALAAASNGQFIPTPGGVLILDGVGAAIGAIGISGDASEKDEYCAITAVHASGLASEPEAPDPEWNQGHL